MADKIQLLSIFSNWYSGATLLSIILNSHSHLVCNGETFPFGHEDPNEYFCACGKKLIECDFYKAVASHLMTDSKNDWNTELFRILPNYSKLKFANRWLNSLRYLARIRNGLVHLYYPYNKKAEEFIDAQIQFIKNCIQFAKAAIYVDGTKSIRRAELFEIHPEIEPKVLYLVRDGRAFVYSYLKNNNLSKDKLRKASRIWLEYIQMVEFFFSKNPHIPKMILRYEDLCYNLQKVNMDISSFLEIPYENFSSAENKPIYHILGNRMRRKFSGKIKEDLTWKTALSASELDLINNLMHKGLKKFDYL